MKKLNLKKKLTFFISFLCLILAIGLVVFMLMISSLVTKKSVNSSLISSARKNAGLITLNEGKLETKEDFTYYSNGITTLIYSKNKALIAGQIPVGFTYDGDFDNGQVKEIDLENSDYLLLDLYVPVNFEEGLWLRSISLIPDQKLTNKYTIYVSLIILPIFLLIAGLGSYFISLKAFKPLDSINETVINIKEGKDLSKRINLNNNHDEFSILANNFNDLFERLEKSFEREKRFVSDVSHELRTPISVIKSASEYGLKYNESDLDNKETLEMILRQSDDMSYLVEQLLSMTRLDIGSTKINFEIIDLGAFVKEILNDLNINNLIININEDIFINADKSLLNRLVNNLLSNAIKFNKEDGLIYLDIYSEVDEAILLIKDEGIGIKKEDQEKIFERFYQADEARSNKGVGLGLCFVKQIADIHEAYITLDSKIDEGSTFKVHFKKINN